MNSPCRDISRFSAKAARRRRLLGYALVFIAIAILAAGSALILAFDESAPLPTYALEFTQDGGTPVFFNPFARSGGRESGSTAYFSVSAQ